jgi:hypothetical protein
MTTEVAIKQLYPKIKKSLYSTSPQNREDLEQELKMKITVCFHNNVFEYTPGFWEFSERFD